MGHLKLARSRRKRHETGMDLRDELVRLACDNRASAQPLSRFGIFPIFPEPGKGERASVFHGDRERQLVFPFYAIRRIRPLESSSAVS